MARLTNRQIFFQHIAQTSDYSLALEIESAKGIYLYSYNGDRYIDLISGIGVSNLGHGHPKVVDAVKKQVEKYMHLMVYGEFALPPQTKLAKALVNTLPMALDSCYFVNSGSEATEGALKLAKRYTFRSEIIYCYGSYHGSTHGAMSVSGNEAYKTNYRPLLPDVKPIRFGFLDDINAISEKTAAVIIETVQGEAGVRTADQKYWKKLRNHCTSVGALLILDEIQCGFGRTGKFWAFNNYQIQPDVLLTAKSMGGGMPLGAFISSQKIMSCLKNNPALGHITTFGGHPVSAAAGLAVLTVIQEEKLLNQVESKRNLFIKNLTHTAIQSIRSCGLMIAVEFSSFFQLKKVVDEAIKLKVLTDWFLNCDNSMRIAPPLTITTEEIEEVCERLNQAIEKATQ